jgi:hypothetical protein
MRLPEIGHSSDSTSASSEASEGGSSRDTRGVDIKERERESLDLK